MMLTALALLGCETTPTGTGLESPRFVDTTLGDLAPLKAGNAWEYEILTTREGCSWHDGHCVHRTDSTLETKTVTVLESTDRGGGETRFTLGKRVRRGDSVRMDTTYSCTSAGNTVQCEEPANMGTFYDGSSTPSIYEAHQVRARFKVDTTGGLTSYRLEESGTTTGTKTWAAGWGLLRYDYTYPKGPTQTSAPTTRVQMRLRKFNGQPAPAT